MGGDGLFNKEENPPKTGAHKNVTSLKSKQEIIAPYFSLPKPC